LVAGMAVTSLCSRAWSPSAVAGRWRPTNMAGSRPSSFWLSSA
jgi:hypothetical protein